MSALADVLSQVAKPGTGRAPRGGALEEIRKYLEQELDPAAAARCSAEIDTLIQLRTVRHSIEHERMSATRRRNASQRGT